MSFNLSEVRAKLLPRLQWSDIIKVSDGELSSDEQSAMASYFFHFTLNDGKCPGCDRSLSGSEIHQALGLTTFTWGIQHGEGFCRECGYPARAFHRNVGPIKSANVILAYHPDELRTTPAASREDARTEEPATATSASAAPDEKGSR